MKRKIKMFFRIRFWNFKVFLRSLFWKLTKNSNGNYEVVERKFPILLFEIITIPISIITAAYLLLYVFLFVDVKTKPYLQEVSGPLSKRKKKEIKYNLLK